MQQGEIQKNKICATNISEKGGCIKAFGTMEELVDYMHASHGADYHRHVKTKEVPTCSKPRTIARKMPPVLHEGEGNCLFIAMAELFNPPLGHTVVRRAVSAFYNNASDEQLDSLSPIYTIEQLRQRARFISKVGTWGEGIDVTAFASIMAMKITALVVTSPRQGLVETVTFMPVAQDGTVLDTDDTARNVLYHNGRNHWTCVEM